jgi:hypothetical protein
MDRMPTANARPMENEPHEDRDPKERGDIDVERLADLVYRLAREEARLARARGARPGR